MIAKTRPAVRLRPPPALDPPYEDDVALEPWGMQLTLQLDGGARRRPSRLALPPIPIPPRPASTGPLAADLAAGLSIRAHGPVSVADVAADMVAAGLLTPATPDEAGENGTGGALAAAGDASGVVVPSAVATSPEAKRAAKRFLDMCLEIFNGYRPAAHIRPLAGQLNAEVVIEQIAAGLERAEQFRRTREPVRTSRRTVLLVQTRRLRVCEPRAGIAEVAAAIGLADRTWALAFRLEQRRGRWLCTAARLI